MNTENIICITPFEFPNIDLALACQKSGACSVLDLGKDFQKGIAALKQLKQKCSQPFGVKLSPSIYNPTDIPAFVNLVIFDFKDIAESLESKNCLEHWRLPKNSHECQSNRKILLQICSLQEAQEACLIKPNGLILKGFESSGRIGNDSSFILLQEVLRLNILFWVQGGMAMHSGAACLIAGAQGIVLDSALSLFKESSLSDEIKKRISHMDGTETKTINHVSVGSDICFAHKFAEKYQTVRAFINALKRSFKSHLLQAKTLSPLKPNSAMARANGTQFPLAQGPMTRVSDRSEFIYEVSKNGALPFLALSLMNQKQAREILTQTTEKLGSLPWGVGILGFISEELQREQLEVLADFKPSAILIAGGKYSQTIQFEKRGIRTFLHVPSPGLLKQFLKDGARRFVFEGRECGGHVGPRSSFVLWELQINVLLEFGFVHEVEVFFAGGIHDAISGAIMAAMAAPLVARGAKVGALIGTAYLFTKEIVETGAILPRFQTEAIRCMQTTLLETSPGHATRCAVTPIVDKFEQKKNELKSMGTEPKKIWSELENFNVGKLRVASKGVERVNDALVAINETRQFEDGLFMLGQVAQLRNNVCTMLTLHKEICEESSVFFENCPVNEHKPTNTVDIAIVGMACIFPGSKNLEEYWHNILTGKNSITEVPKSRWDSDIYFKQNSNHPSQSISKWGAFIDDFEFDAMEYGIPPNSIASIEPVQLLSLKVAKEALADAGYLEKEFDREKTSVIFGAESGSDLSAAYGFRALFPQYAGQMPKELDEFLPELTEESFPGVLANVITGRIANRLDLGGSNYTVDAACASSIAALDLSVKELVLGKSDMVLCGGADLHNCINDYLMFSSVQALSPTGESQPFSAKANGIVLGEGIAVIVLKRFQDAIEDGDRIYSIIKAVGSSSDGKSLGLTAPRKEGQMRALYRAYEAANVCPSKIELIEAHGTGTVLGDHTELETITEVFLESGVQVYNCALGSVKSQIGHTKCAAGLAGLIKASLSLYYETIPPTLHLEHPNPFYQRGISPFFFTKSLLPWTSSERHAAVSAFGFGGTNFHTILTSHHNAAPQNWSHELFVFKDKTELKQFSEILEKHAELNLARLAKMLCPAQLDRRTQDIQISIVAKNIQDLTRKVQIALKNEKENGIFYANKSQFQNGKIAFIFSGQGSQNVYMGAEIFSVFPHLNRYLKLGEKWSSFIFPKGVETNSEKMLRQTSIAQPALGIVELAIYHLTQELGIRPDFLGGHSYGELVAHCLAEGIVAEDILQLSESRGLAMEKVAQGKNGSMAAVFANAEIVKNLIQDLFVVIANYNSPLQTVISGLDSEIELAMRKFSQNGIRCTKIPVSTAFHSPLMAGAEKEFLKELSKTKLPFKKSENLSNQIIEPVQFINQIEDMYQNGARIFLEIGPNHVLTKLIGQILNGRPHYVQSFDRSGEKYGATTEQILFVLAELLSFGISVNLTRLFERSHLTPYHFSDLHSSVSASNRTTFLINGQRARPKHESETPNTPKKPKSFSLAPLDTREDMVKNYLISMRQLVESQRQVMLEFLSSGQKREEPSLHHHIPPKQIALEEKSSTKPECDISATVIKIVSQKTGYPEEMMGLDQDLESDLSIGSIKHFEIIAEIGEKLGLNNQMGDGKGLEQLASATTLRKLIALIEAQINPKTETSINQYFMEPREIPLIKSAAKSVENFLIGIIEDKKGLSKKLANTLYQSHAKVIFIKNVESWNTQVEQPLDCLIVMSLMDEDSPKTIEVFQLLQVACKHATKSILGIMAQGENFSLHASKDINRRLLGISGLFKSLAKEYKNKMIKIIHLDPHEDHNELAQTIFNEIQFSDKIPEISYEKGVRNHLVPLPYFPNLNHSNHLKLHKDSTILMLGGARGIASKIAIKLAQEYGCKFEIIGRSPFTHTENQEISKIEDLQGLKNYFIKAEVFKTPSEIQYQCKKILDNREIRKTLKTLQNMGSQANYHSFDVRDKHQLSQWITDFYNRGNIDGVIHAAGVLNDSRFLEKTDETFSKVFETKVNPAEVLIEKLKNDIKFIALFSSVSGCFGNIGQADYSAANSALDTMARLLNEKITGRVISFNWGPWAEVGMVTPELEKEYRKQGIDLIPPDLGVQYFFNELIFGDGKKQQIVIMGGTVEKFINLQ